MIFLNSSLPLGPDVNVKADQMVKPCHFHPITTQQVIQMMPFFGTFLTLLRAKP